VSGVAGDAIEIATRLYERGLDAMEYGRPGVAVRALSRAHELLAGDVPTSADSARLRARVLITLANAEFELVGLAPSLERLAVAEQVVAASSALSDLQVSLHNQRGLFLLRLGRQSEALAEFELAEGCFASAPVTEQARVLLNRATVHLADGRLASARNDLQRSAAAARHSHVVALRPKALHNLGYAEFLAGDLPRALELMDEAFPVREGEIPGIALLDRARVLAEAGLTREADEALAEAARIFRRDRLAQDLAETELERARCALVSGDVAAARRLAGRARDRFRSRGNHRWRREAELTLLQADLAAARPGSRLAPPAQRLRDELLAEGHQLAAATATRIAAEALLAAGRRPEATALLPAARAALPEPITARLHDRYVRARLAAATGDTRAAARHVRSGLADLARYQAGFGSIDLQTASAVHGARLAELGIAVALASGRPDAVFAAAERGRAVSTRLPAVQPPDDPDSAELLGELRQVVEQLRGVGEGNEQARTLLRRRRELERAVAGRRWALAGAGAPRQIARPDAARAELGDAVMIMYVEVGGMLHAVRVDAGRSRLHTLGDANAVAELIRRSRADLDVLTQSQLPAALRDAVRAATRRGLAALDAALLAPLRVDGRRLVIVSTGVLGQVAWGMLPSLRGVPVVVAPSASAWLAAASVPASRRRFAAAVFAGPDLARAPHEAKAIVDVWGERARLAEPTGAGLTRAVSRATLLHVAAHGAHQTENPLFSTLRLADGPLFAYELDRTGRVPEHVVLSACELGLATVRPGDEALGLTSVLLHLGTRSVVAGVGRVGDEACEAAMVAYHGLLAAGADTAAALAEVTAAEPLPLVCFGAAVRFGRRPPRRVP